MESSKEREEEKGNTNYFFENKSESSAIGICKVKKEL